MSNDLFISYEFRCGPYVCIQATTEQGRDWLQSIKIGKIINEVLVLQSNSVIDYVLSKIPSSLRTMTI